MAEAESWVPVYAAAVIHLIMMSTNPHAGPLKRGNGLGATKRPHLPSQGLVIHLVEAHVAVAKHDTTAKYSMANTVN